MLVDKTIKFSFAEFAQKKSLVPSGEKLFCFPPQAWPPWRQLKTNNFVSCQECFKCLCYLNHEEYTLHQIILWGWLRTQFSHLFKVITTLDLNWTYYAVLSVQILAYLILRPHILSYWLLVCLSPSQISYEIKKDGQFSLPSSFYGLYVNRCITWHLGHLLVNVSDAIIYWSSVGQVLMVVSSQPVQSIGW